MHTCKSSTQGAEARGLRFYGQPLYSKTLSQKISNNNFLKRNQKKKKTMLTQVRNQTVSKRLEKLHSKMPMMRRSQQSHKGPVLELVLLHVQSKEQRDSVEPKKEKLWFFHQVPVNNNNNNKKPNCFNLSTGDSAYSSVAPQYRLES